jgi:GNAT superfamily N-acetyltransferase
MCVSQSTVVQDAQQRESARIRRRLDRFRRAGMFTETEGLTIKQASTAEELHEAYALVHDVFVQRGYILPLPGGMRIRPYEALPEMATFIAKAENRVVAVMSVVPDTEEFGLPSDKAFGAEIDSLRAAGRVLCETTNLAVDPNYRNGGVFLELVRCCTAHAAMRGYDDSFISISEGHALFFESILGFEAWGDRRNYGDSTVDFVEGKRLDLTCFAEKIARSDAAMGPDAFLCDWFFERNPYLSQVAEWDRLARERFLNPRLLRRLFVEESSFLYRCDDSVIAGLRRRWGDALLDQVLGGRLSLQPELLAA